MVQCNFCPRGCRLKEGEVGFCTIRKNVGGVIKTINYGHPVTASVDVIEKKPLYHFYPGARTLSIALFGCNLRCKFCQNYRITQPEALESGISSAYIKGGFGESISPKEIADSLFSKGDKILSYTYSEPTVWQDYMVDCADEVHSRGGYNVMVTNGTFSGANREQVIDKIDAFNIDLKGGDRFYKEYCEGFRKPVLETIKMIAKRGDKHLEVTTLLIEGVHTVSEIVKQGEFLASAGVRVWHLSRFFPHYKMQDNKATSERFLAEVISAVRGVGIPYIYAGNSSSTANANTICPNCGKPLIMRGRFSTGVTGVRENITDGFCAECGEVIYGRF